VGYSIKENISILQIDFFYRPEWGDILITVSGKPLMNQHTYFHPQSFADQ